MPFSRALHNKPLNLPGRPDTALARSTIEALVMRDALSLALTFGQGRARSPRRLAATLGVQKRTRCWAMPNITRDAVLNAIHGTSNRKRIIWTPAIVLERMHLGRYPDYPRQEYERTKTVLAELCAEGLLIRRPELHSYYTLRETAYMRPDDAVGRNLGPTMTREEPDT